MIRFLHKIARIYLFFPTAIVLIIIMIPFIANLFGSNEVLLDNRELNKKPEEFSLSFARDFENYYNDTFIWRKKFIKKLAKWKMRFKFDSETFIHGEHGWMFYDSGKVPDGYTLLDFFGKVHYNDAQLKSFASGIQKASDYYKAQGIDYLIFITPNKENLYAEYMPERLRNERVSDMSRMDVAVKYLQKNTDVKIINLKDVLMQAKEELPIKTYYLRDTHWNNVGAYLGFNEMLKLLNKYGYNIPVKKLEYSMVVIDGEYQTDMDIVDGETHYNVLYKDNVEAKCLKNEDNGFMQVYETPNAHADKTLLMIRDSFGLALIPYLNKTFKKTIFAHTKHNKRLSLDELVKEHHPDIVVDELVERYFERFLKYNDMYGDVK